MNENILKHTLFFDIETVSGFSDYSQLPNEKRELWAYRHPKYATTELDTPEKTYNQCACLEAEFGKIVAISFGAWDIKSSQWRIANISDESELLILQKATQIINQWSVSNPSGGLCGHNIMNFDIPYLSKKIIMSRLPLPNLLKTFGKKPWELNHIDTMTVWSMGAWGSNVKFVILCDALGIKTPKGDMDGGMVNSVYYNEKNYRRIADYCSEDVRATIEVAHSIFGCIPEEGYAFNKLFI